MTASLPNHDLHTTLVAGPNDRRVQLVNADGGSIGDQGERALGWVLAGSIDVGTFAPRHRDEPVVLATFDIHCSLVVPAGN